MSEFYILDILSTETLWFIASILFQNASVSQKQIPAKLIYQKKKKTSSNLHNIILNTISSYRFIYP